MKAVDTNVLARLILQDDARQTEQARAIVREPVWITYSVWVELGWILGRRLKLDRDVVADAMSAVLMMDTIHVADRDGLGWAIDRYRGGADWADAIHLSTARGASDAFVTFDKAIARQIGDSPIPIETLA